MVSKSVENRIKKMISLCDELIKKCDGKTIDDLRKDNNFAEATCFVLGQIGEQVPGYKIAKDGTSIKEADYDEFFKEYKDINWLEIKGTRNKIYHDYDGVNMLIIWDTIKDIPNFKNKLEKLLSK